MTQEALELLPNDRLLFVNHRKLYVYAVPEPRLHEVANLPEPPHEDLPGADCLYSFAFEGPREFVYGGISDVHFPRPMLSRIILCTAMACYELLIPECREEESSVSKLLKFDTRTPVFNVGSERAFALDEKTVVFLQFCERRLYSQTTMKKSDNPFPECISQRDRVIPLMDQISGRIIPLFDNTAFILDTASYGAVGDLPADLPKAWWAEAELDWGYTNIQAWDSESEDVW